MNSVCIRTLRKGRTILIEQVYETMIGALVKDACVPGVQDAFAVGMPCTATLSVLSFAHRRKQFPSYHHKSSSCNGALQKLQLMVSTNLDREITVAHIQFHHHDDTQHNNSGLIPSIGSLCCKVHQHQYAIKDSSEKYSLFRVCFLEHPQMA